MNEQIRKLMEGAWDTHVHANPGIFENRDSIVELARAAKEYGMKGLVFKDLHFCTAPQARIVMEVIPGIDIVGGVALNGTLGGVNPWAVEASFKAGGKVVWMFCLDSAFQVAQFSKPDYPFPPSHNRNLLVDIESGGFTVFKDGTDELKDEALEIIALCKQYDGVLETSHLSPEEAFAMAKACKDQKVTVVLTHANAQFTMYTIEQQKAFVELGGLVSYTYDGYMPWPAKSAWLVSDLVKQLKAVGLDNVLLGTDCGLTFWPSGVDIVRMMIVNFLGCGLTEEEIEKMIKTNAARVYGL